MLLFAMSVGPVPSRRYHVYRGALPPCEAVAVVLVCIGKRTVRGVDSAALHLCRDCVLLGTDLQTALRIVCLHVGAAECGIAPPRGIDEDDAVLGGVQICRADRPVQDQLTAVHLIRLAAREHDRILDSGYRDCLPRCPTPFESAVGAAHLRISSRERVVDAVLLHRQAEFTRLTAYGCFAARDVDSRTIRRKCRRTGEMQLVLGNGRRRCSRLCRRSPIVGQNLPLERAPVRP